MELKKGDGFIDIQTPKGHELVKRLSGTAVRPGRLGCWSGKIVTDDIHQVDHTFEIEKYFPGHKGTAIIFLVDTVRRDLGLFCYHFSGRGPIYAVDDGRPVQTSGRVSN